MDSRADGGSLLGSRLCAGKFGLSDASVGLYVGGVGLFALDAGLNH